MRIDHHYAREKLTLLLRDLDSYNGDEFWRQMSRIAHGATDHPSAEALLLERDALAAHVERLRNAINEATDKHIAFAKRMALDSNHTSMMAVDKADSLLVRASFHVPVDTSCLAHRDAQQQRTGIINACNHVLSMGSPTHRAFLTHGRYAYLSTRALREYADTLTEQPEATPCPPR